MGNNNRYAVKISKCSFLSEKELTRYFDVKYDSED